MTADRSHGERANREREPRPCEQCGQLFVPSHGAQRYDRKCAAARQRASWQRRRDQGYQPPKAKPAATPTNGKRWIGAVAPDFLRLLPELRAELERVAPLGSRLQSREYRSVPLADLGCVQDRRGE